MAKPREPTIAPGIALDKGERIKLDQRRHLVPAFVKVKMIAQQCSCAEARVDEELGDVAANALHHLISEQGMVTDIWLGWDSCHPIPEKDAALF
jgi:hypothetical protein